MSANRRNSQRRTRRGFETLEPRAMLSVNLAFDDEFNLAAGSQPNTSNWLYNTGVSPNNSNVNYTDTTSTLQIVNDSGATDGKALAMSLYPDPNNAGKYLGARINTSIDPTVGNWQYGHIEARIKLPGGPNGQGVGIWPAFWLLGSNVNQVGWPNCGEIDIMENKGSTPNEIQGTIHGPGYSGGSGITAHYDLPSGQNFYSGYHVFAVDWGPNFVNFLVDGQLYASRTPANLPSGTTWAFNHPFYIILDIQEGGAFAGGPGPNSIYPQTMLVDYVRAAAFPLSAVPAFADADIGSPGVPGFSNFDGVAWTIQGSGSDIWNTSDQFHFTSETFGGDVTITARVDNLTNSGTFAKAGIMIRNGTAANAPYAFVFVDPPNGQTGDGANFELRSAPGVPSQAVGSVAGATAPLWLRLQRVGNNFTAFDSSDGVNWAQLGPTESIAMSGTVNVGLAVSANTNSALNTAMFQSVAVVPGGWSDADIGSPGAAGFAAFNSTGGSWTTSGGGTDIFNAADQFNFASRALIGDGNVVSQVTALADTNAWAKAGVMLRNDETPGSAFADVLITPGNGVSFEWRASAGAAAASTTIAGIAAPIWVRLSRSGNTFSGYYSTNGTTWTQIGTAKTVAMATSALAGLAVSAHDNADLAGATFNSVSVLSDQVSNVSDSGPGSLRQALSDAATVPSASQPIRFALPSSSQTISLLTPLPTIGQPLTFLLDSTQNVTLAFPPGTVWNNGGALTLSGAGALTLNGAIEGTGNLTIGAGGRLTANHLIQNSLIIGGTAGSPVTVTIAASDASGNPLTALGSQASPTASSSSLASASANAIAAPNDAVNLPAILHDPILDASVSNIVRVPLKSADDVASARIATDSRAAGFVPVPNPAIAHTDQIAALFDQAVDFKWSAADPTSRSLPADTDIFEIIGNYSGTLGGHTSPTR